MSTTHRIGLLLFAGFAFVLGNTFAGAQVEKSKEPAKLPKWEYKRVTNPTDNELQTAGDEGWEVAAALSFGLNGSSRSYVFKRPKQ